MGKRRVTRDSNENLTSKTPELEPTSEFPEATKGEGAPLAGSRRFGYALLGLAIAAMGFWIFPYQLERGDLPKTLTGAALAIIGSIVMYRALSRSRLRSLEKLIDFLSDLAG